MSIIPSQIMAEEVSHQFPFQEDPEATERARIDWIKWLIDHENGKSIPADIQELTPYQEYQRRQNQYDLAWALPPEERARYTIPPQLGIDAYQVYDTPGFIRYTNRFGMLEAVKQLHPPLLFITKQKQAEPATPNVSFTDNRGNAHGYILAKNRKRPLDPEYSEPVSSLETFDHQAQKYGLKRISGVVLKDPETGDLQHWFIPDEDPGEHTSVELEKNSCREWFDIAYMVAERLNASPELEFLIQSFPHQPMSVFSLSFRKLHFIGIATSEVFRQTYDELSLVEQSPLADLITSYQERILRQGASD